MLDEIIPLALAQAQSGLGENISVTVVIPPEEVGGHSAQYQVDFIRRGEKLEFEAVTIVQ